MTVDPKPCGSPRQRGFTLVELAIVLVVIGLIIGGVLRGVEMIESAREKSVVKQVEDTIAAWAVFLDRYGFNPGDFPKGNPVLGAPLGVSWEKCTGRTNRGQCNGDGAIEWNERFYFWQHLAAADLLHGVEIDPTPSKPENTAYPNLQVGGYLSLWEGFNIGAGTWKDPNRPGHWLEASLRGEGGGPGPLDADRVKRIDLKYDDGNPGRGWIRVLSSPCHTGSTGSAPADSDWVIEGENCRFGFSNRF